MCTPPTCRACRPLAVVKSMNLLAAKLTHPLAPTQRRPVPSHRHIPKHCATFHFNRASWRRLSLLLFALKTLCVYSVGRRLKDWTTHSMSTCQRRLSTFATAAAGLPSFQAMGPTHLASLHGSMIYPLYHPPLLLTPANLNSRALSRHSSCIYRLPTAFTHS